KYTGFENVDPRIDRIASYFLGFGLLQESPNATVLNCFYQPVCCWIRHGGQHYCCGSLFLPMATNHVVHVDVRQHVPVKHDGGLADQARGIAIGASGTERRCFDRITDSHVIVSPVADLILDLLWLIRQRQNYISNIGPFEQFELVEEKWLVGN